jgi:hypothetical protein
MEYVLGGWVSRMTMRTVALECSRHELCHLRQAVLWTEDFRDASW